MGVRGSFPPGAVLYVPPMSPHGSGREAFEKATNRQGNVEY